MDQLKSPTINIALAFTDNYWALAYAVMRSICLTTVRRKDLVFHLCHPPLQPHHAAVIDRILEEFSPTIIHYDPKDNPSFQNLVAQLPHTERFPSIIYARMLLDTFLPQDAERVIYLDCDIMVVQPIELLYEIDMQGHPIAAAFDPYHLGIKKGRDIKQKQNALDTGDLYFNSGVLLIDLARYRAANVPARIAEMASTGQLKNLFFDQDLLNLIFLHNWQPLSWRFNLLGPRPEHESLHPAILHYTGTRQPWNLRSNVAFQRQYRHVMTNDIYYRFFAERAPKWLGPLINWGRVHNMKRVD